MPPNPKSNGHTRWPQLRRKRTKGEETVVVALSRNQWDIALAALSNMVINVREDYADEPRNRDRMVLEIKLIMSIIGGERERE